LLVTGKGWGGAKAKKRKKEGGLPGCALSIPLKGEKEKRRGKRGPPPVKAAITREREKKKATVGLPRGEEKETGVPALISGAGPHLQEGKERHYPLSLHRKRKKKRGGTEWRTAGAKRPDRNGKGIGGGKEERNTPATPPLIAFGLQQLGEKKEGKEKKEASLTIPNVQVDPK